MAEIDDVVINIEGTVNNENAQAQSLPEDNRTSDNINNSFKAKQEAAVSVLFEKLGVINSSNPWICIIHVAFKVVAAFTYLFGGFLLNSVLIFIFVSMISVCDFWIVKNLSGRLLTGLRWWTLIDANGNEQWMFTSFDYKFKVNAIDSSFFWYGQMASALFWLTMLTIKLLTLSPFWIMLAGICCFLTLTNLYAYYRCNKDYQNKISSAMSSATTSNFLLRMMKLKLGF